MLDQGTTPTSYLTVCLSVTLSLANVTLLLTPGQCVFCCRTVSALFYSVTLLYILTPDTHADPTRTPSLASNSCSYL